ncbi:hypothetical protein MN116_000452, partial [Schistosoma mekongi]
LSYCSYNMADLVQTKSLEDKSSVDIDTVMTSKIRLPEFDRSDPELWFAQLEHYFIRHNIKSEGVRYRDLCSILPPSVAKEVRDLILSPPTPQPYTILRREIMSRLSLSDGQRIQRLFQGETLGDRSPSQFLRHLQALVAKEVRDLILSPPTPQPYTILRREIMSRLSLSDGQRIQRLFQGETLGDRSPSQFLRHLQALVGDNTVGEAVLKQGWIQALPCYVQHCLDAQDPDTSLSHLARIADRIMERDPPTASSMIHYTRKEESANDPVIAQLIANVKSLTEAVNELQMGHKNRSRSPQRPRFVSRNRLQGSRQSGQFCWYHWKFGAQSTKCSQPCAWPKQTQKNTGNE